MLLSRIRLPNDPSARTVRADRPRRLSARNIRTENPRGPSARPRGLSATIVVVLVFNGGGAAFVSLTFDGGSLIHWWVCGLVGGLVFVIRFPVCISRLFV